MLNRSLFLFMFFRNSTNVDGFCSIFRRNQSYSCDNLAVSTLPFYIELILYICLSPLTPMLPCIAGAEACCCWTLEENMASIASSMGVIYVMLHMCMKAASSFMPRISYKRFELTSAFPLKSPYIPHSCTKLQHKPQSSCCIDFEDEKCKFESLLRAKTTSYARSGEGGSFSAMGPHCLLSNLLEVACQQQAGPEAKGNRPTNGNVALPQ